MTDTSWKKINESVYEKDIADSKHQLSLSSDQLILDLKDFQFGENFEFSEERRDSHKSFLKNQQILIEGEIPIHQKSIRCIGKLKDRNSIYLINSNKSFSDIEISITNYQQKPICGHIRLENKDSIYFELGISPDQFELLLKAISDERYIASLVVRIQAFRYDVERAFDDRKHGSYFLEENKFYQADLTSLNLFTENQEEKKIDFQKNIKKEKEKFLRFLKSTIFPVKNDDEALENPSLLKNPSKSEIFWQHQDILGFFDKYKKPDTRYIIDSTKVMLINNLVQEYLQNYQLSDPYIDWLFLNFLTYQEIAQFALIIKQKIRKFLGLVKNKDYFSSIKLWLKMRDFYELLKPPILTPNLIKLQLFEGYKEGIRWGWEDYISPLVYKIAQSNPEYMLVKPI